MGDVAEVARLPRDAHLASVVPTLRKPVHRARDGDAMSGSAALLAQEMKG